MNQRRSPDNLRSPSTFQDLTCSNWIQFSQHAVLAEGPLNGAVFDFETGNVLSLNSGGKEAARRFRCGIALTDLMSEWESEGRAREDLIRFCKALAGHGVLDHRRLKESAQESLCEAAESAESGLGFVWLEVTEQCNMHCVHCYNECSLSSHQSPVEAPSTDARQVSALTVNEWLHAITAIAALGCRRIQFIGGEPTLYPELRRLISHAKSSGIDFIEVYSNGTLVCDEMMDFFREHGVHVAISFYSKCEEIHDQITQQPGSHAATLRTLEALRDRGVPTRLGIVVMKQNEAGVDETVRFLKSRGFDRVGVDGLRPTGRGANGANACRQYDSVRRRPVFRAHLEDFVNNQARNSCWYGKAAISSTGNVMPCIFARDEVLGNVRTSELAEIIDSQRTQEAWHITHDQVEVCRECEYRYVCRDCRALPLGAGRDLYGQSTRCSYNPRSGEWAEFCN